MGRALDCMRLLHENRLQLKRYPGHQQPQGLFAQLLIS
jgi:hypothetical protein